MDELINALKTIKKTCEQHDDCEDCPLGRLNGDCELETTQPNRWNIHENTIVRLL